MKTLTEQPNHKEKAILVGLIHRNQPREKVDSYLGELAFLLETAGGICVAKFVQKLDHPDPRTFVGSGKLREIADFMANNPVQLLVFDDELSPSQIRNIEQFLACRVIDRSNLILDIFAFRARTSYAKTQVELAQYQYLLPRLAGMWTHLEKQRGGIGLKGPGEKEIETDRRVIRDRIALLREKLKEIDKQKQVQRKNRDKMVRVALVGYTNAGKSTLMNLLSRSEVFAEDKLFATLDTTVRKTTIQNITFLLTDTVGFIRKLPHALVESFKSTLDEVFHADLLLHVVDISHPEFEEQMEVVKQTLNEIGACEKPIIHVFNKIDKYMPPVAENPGSVQLSQTRSGNNSLNNTWMAGLPEKSVFVSALRHTHTDELKQAMFQEVSQLHLSIYPHEPFSF